MVVYSPSKGAYRSVGAEIAEERGDEVVTDVARINEPADTVVCVGAPGDISSSDLLFMQERLLGSAPDEGGFSVVTGLTPEAAHDLYFERQLGDGHAVVATGELPDGIAFDDATTGLTGEVSIDSISSLTDRRLDTYSLRTHGWSIHLTLPDGYVCGVPESVSFDDYDGSQPACVRGGTKDCPLDGELVSAESIDAAHVFVGSCTSMIDNNLHGLPVHVGLGLLDGADSLVGSYRPGSTHPVEAVLHHALVRAGYDVVERCYVLNRFSHGNAIMSYPYVPFGAPDAQSGRSVRPTYDASVEMGSDGTVVSLTDVNAHVVDVTVPADALPATDDCYYVRTQATRGHDGSLLYAAFEHGGDLRLLAFDGGLITASRIDLVVSPTPTAYRERRIVRQSLERATASNEFNLPVGTDQLQGLWHQVRDFPTKVWREGFDATANEAVRAEVERPFGNVSALRDGLLTLASEGSLPSEKYGTRAVDDDVFPDTRPCPICESRVFIKQVGDGTGTKRAIGKCTRCGPIYDVPTTAGDRRPPRPTFVVDTDGSSGRAVVGFRNPTEVEMRTAVRPFKVGVGTEDGDGEQFFTPQTRELEIAPGERATLQFDFDAGLIRTAKAHVAALVVGNLGVFSASTWFQKHD